MKKNTPKSTNSMIPPVIAAGLVLVAVAVFAFVLLPKAPVTGPPLITDLSPITSIPHFENEAQLIAAFKDAQSNGGNTLFARDAMGPATPTAAPTAGGKSESSGDAASGPEYSNTNVQTQGVDEADIVKTDGEYIYAFYKNKVIITKATPASDMKVAGTIFLDDVYPVEMYVQDDQLVLIGNAYTSPPIVYADKRIAGDAMWYPYWNYSRSVIQVYDISDKDAPTKVKDLEFPGSYVSSRLIEGHAYFVITTYPEYRVLEEGSGSTESIIPPYKEDGVEKKLATATQIGYLPPVDAQSFITIVSLDLDSKRVEKETIVGRADSVYASKDNLYLTAAQYNYGWGGGIMPLVRAGTEDGSTVDSDAGTTSTMPALEGGVNETKTLIYKFHLDNGNVSFEGRGRVPGTVLNQFSMDEFDNHFRIATTVDAQWGPMGQEVRAQRNSVYVLDSDMDVVGELEDLAPSERIYSARFMGDRAYLVTFRQVDPLFVIDLSDAENPRVLGKLKIPGYSNYLHPIDRTHILGIGMDTEEAKDGEVVFTAGMKMAIFDVSDVENPIQMHAKLIGDRGTSSPALYDHKAFLFDAEKQLLVLPIDLYEVSDSNPDEPAWGPEYGQSVFQGAFAYRVTLEEGFEELGRITHISDEDALKAGHYWDYRFQVQRALYIGDVLYTVSQKMIKANDLANGLEEISSVELVNTPADFVVTARVQGVFCAGECGYQQIILSKSKMITDNVSGGEDPTIYHSEQPAYSTYDDIIETLDWDAFQALEETQGCPGCADGPVLTITIKKGSETKTVRMEAGMKVEKIQAFLDAIGSYVGLYGGGGIYYPLAENMAGGTTGSVAPAVAVAEPEPAQ